MSLGSDNLDRVMDDIDKALKEMPPAAIGAVLEKWQIRIKEIRTQLDFVNASVASPAAREADTLETAIREIRAACAVEQGDGLRALRILLQNKP